MLGVLVAVTLTSFPTQSAEADVENAVQASSTSTALVVETGSVASSTEAVYELPTYEQVKVLREYRYVPMTAYTSRPEETDDTPFITADGSHVRDGIVACNFLPFGTKVRIPSLFGDKIFEVHDRMNKRYSYKMDFWMEGLTDARKFGVKYAHIEVVEVETVNAK